MRNPFRQLFPEQSVLLSALAGWLRNHGASQGNGVAHSADHAQRVAGATSRNCRLALMRAALATEHQEQVAVIRWSELAQREFPDLALLHAIPNAGKRTIRAAMWMKAEGLKRGVPDLHLPVAKGGYHGLWIEMKRGTLKASDEQVRWGDMLRSAGHRVELCRSAAEAVTVIRAYLRAELLRGS